MTLRIRENALLTGLDPRALPGLEAWYDAEYVNGFGNALPANLGAVSEWHDLSGHSRHLTQTASGQRPLFISKDDNLIDPSLTQMGSGVTYNALTGEYSIPANSGLYFWAKIDGAAKWYFSFDGWTDTASTQFTPNGGRLMTSTYFADDRTTMVTNTDNYQSNGNAALMPLNTWSRQSWGYDGGPNVVWFRMYISNAAPYVAGTLKVRAPVLRTSAALWNASPISLGPVVSFDGVDDILSTASSVTVNGGTTTPVTCYIVWEWYGNNSGSSNSRALDWNYQLYAPPGTMGSYLAVGKNIGAATNVSSAAPHCAMLGGDNVDTAFSSVDGGSLSSTTGAGQPVLSGNIQVGAILPGTTAPLYGAISSILVYSELHNDATRHRIERYLAGRYGITLSS